MSALFRRTAPAWRSRPRWCIVADFAVRIFEPLAHPPLAALWGALTLVELGAHIGNFALIWLAVQLIGDAAAYLQSLQFAAVICGAALGGFLFDERDPRTVLIGAYVVRASAALSPLLATWVTGSPLIGLVIASVGLALAQAQAEPAAQASLTISTREGPQRQAANALIFATTRVARLIGRGIPGLLTVVIPVLHLFTLNAVFIALAALLLMTLPRAPVSDRAGSSPLRGAFAGARHMLAHRELRILMVATSVSFAIWPVVVSLGPALIVHAREASWLGLPPAACYSLLLAAYGAGNLFGAGSRGLSPSPAFVFAGQAVFGLGAIVIGLAGALVADAWLVPTMLGAIFVAGIGAPALDLRVSNLIQSSGPIAVVSALARVRMVVGWGSMCLSTLSAPSLFGQLGVASCVAASGAASIILAGWAHRRLGKAAT